MIVTRDTNLIKVTMVMIIAMLMLSRMILVIMTTDSEVRIIGICRNMWEDAGIGGDMDPQLLG